MVTVSEARHRSHRAELVQRRFTKWLHGYASHSYSERLRLLQLPSLELRRLQIDLIWCYKIVLGQVDLCTSEFFDLRLFSSTRGRPYKIFKRRTSCTTRSEFFAERVVHVWNTLPHSVVDFSTLTAFKRSIERVDLSTFCLVT